MRPWLSAASVAAALLLGFSPGALSQTRPSPAAPNPETEPAGAYQSLDDARLVKNLEAMGMTELLQGLAERNAGSDDVARLNLAVSALLAMAARDPSPEAADATIDQALAIQDKVVAAARNGAADKDKTAYFRAALFRIVIEGLTRSDPYVQRMQYLLDSPADRRKVVQFTANTVPSLEQLDREMAATYESWLDDEHRISGVVFELENLRQELAFRKGWALVYRGMAMDKSDQTAQQRSGLLTKAIATLADFANASDDQYGVKYSSLLATGMALRELGEYAKARECLRKVLDKPVPRDLQFKALFEIAHAGAERGTLDQVQAAVQEFRAAAAGLNVAPVAIAMQSTLLLSRAYEARSEALKASDPEAAADLAARSAQTVLDFIKANPACTAAFVDVIGSKYEGRDVEDLPSPVLMRMAAWQAARNIPAAAREAERLLKVVLARGDAQDLDSRFTAAVGLGRICAEQGRSLEAAAYFRQAADMLPRDPRAKLAALDAVQSLGRVLNDPTAAPGDADQAEYLLDLETLVKHWGADRDVRPHYYYLGLQYERVAQAPQAIEAFERVDTACETYLPSQFHALSLRAKEMLDHPDPNETARRAKATGLLARLAQFHRAAAEYRSGDATRQQSAQEMGAEADLLAARTRLDLLNQSAEARKTAEQVMEDWPDVAGIQDRSLVLQVEASLKDGDLDAAIQLVERVPGSAESMVAEIVSQVRQKIDRMDPATDAQKLRSYVGAYTRLADSLHKSARDRLESEAAGKPAEWLAQRMYPYNQALAGAYECSDEPEKLHEAMRIYQSLAKQKPDDALNLRGMARCYRRLKANIEALGCYNRLVNGLPRRSAEWWEAQWERLQFAAEIHGDQPQEMRKIALELRLLGEQDSAMGGPALEPKFRELRAKVDRSVASSPAASRPVK